RPWLLTAAPPGLQAHTMSRLLQLAQDHGTLIAGGRRHEPAFLALELHVLLVHQPDGQRSAVRGKRQRTYRAQLLAEDLFLLPRGHVPELDLAAQFRAVTILDPPLTSRCEGLAVRGKGGVPHGNLLVLERLQNLAGVELPDVDRGIVDAHGDDDK